MQYTKEMHRFLDLLREKFGYGPEHYEHHVLICTEDGKWGFAYRDSDGWVILAPYDKYSPTEYSSVGSELNAAIVKYEVDHAEELAQYSQIKPEIKETPSVEIRDAQKAIEAGKVEVRRTKQPKPNPFGGMIDPKGLPFEADDINLPTMKVSKMPRKDDADAD